MALFKHKPSLIDATQWFPGGHPVPGVTESGDVASVETPLGPMAVRPGDWVFTDENGYRWSHPDRSFRENYEEA